MDTTGVLAFSVHDEEIVVIIWGGMYMSGVYIYPVDSFLYSVLV